MTKLIAKLQERLQAPLPGIEAQLMMASKQIATGRGFYEEIPEPHKKASVMALLYRKNGVWHTALMQRPESPYAHSKQVSFPGGGVEAKDTSLQAAALRETEEEFGIPTRQIQVIGRLSHLYIPVSGYLVHPFVGYMASPPQFVPDPEEVAEILEVPIRYLVDQSLRKLTTIKTSSGFVLNDVPYFDLHDRVVWGATAMMLSEFSELLKELEDLLD